MKKDNITKNMLTLKALKAELDSIKQNKNLLDSTVNPNLTPPRKSYSPLFLFTFIIAYIHKIPFVSKIIKLLKLWYGRTTWWHLLAKVRKAFVVFNAIIGIMAMINSVDVDISLDGLRTLLYSYLTMFKSFGTNVLHWFADKLGIIIVPNQTDINYPKTIEIGSHKDDIDRIRIYNAKRKEYEEVLKKIEELQRLEQKRSLSNWFSWVIGASDSLIPSWVWYTGIAVVSAGVIFIGYKLISDPYGVADKITPNKKGITSGSAGGGPDIKFTGEASTSAVATACVKRGEGGINRSCR